MIAFPNAFFLGSAVCMLLATSAQSQTPRLTFPLRCTLGENCWTARYMDRAAGNAKTDYRAGNQTQDKHKGTDLVVPDLGAVARGVDVLAAADGVVVRRRDGMADTPASDKKEVDGKECGNAVVVQHAGGWETQYCHLKKGSLKFKTGDAVKAGDPIAQVGLSGLTEFPHLHFMLRQTVANQPARDIDPFDGGLFEVNPAATHNPQGLWQTAIPYRQAAVLPPLVTATATDRHSIWQAQEVISAQNAEALIVQARGFNTRANDVWRFTLYGPDDRVRFTRDIVQNNDRQLVQTFAGMKKPTEGFVTGVWSAEVSLLRGGTLIGTRKQLMTLTP